MKTKNRTPVPACNHSIIALGGTQTYVIQEAVVCCKSLAPSSVPKTLVVRLTWWKCDYFQDLASTDMRSHSVPLMIVSTIHQRTSFETVGIDQYDVRLTGGP
eukprot:scaffold50_cov114-Amphora_coffeaeformis.AAC.1